MRSVEPNIFGSFYKNRKDRVAYICDCVDKYSDDLDKSQAFFLKHFTIEVLKLLYVADSNTACSPEKHMDIFVNFLCRFSADIDSFICEGIKYGIEVEELLYQKADELDICDVMADFLVDESLKLEKIHVSSMLDYDEESQKIIFTITNGEYYESMDSAIVRLQKTSIRNIASRIDKDLYDLMVLLHSS